jgi:TetR/AcrR family transcriptional repressor of nem operon
VGRKLEFDRDRAIDRATRVFWKKGYSNASLRELLNAMGIGEGSFYNTVGSKKQLFIECLKHYEETVERKRLEALLAEASVKKGVRAFFKSVLDSLDDPSTPRLCLLAESLSGDVLRDRQLKNYLENSTRSSWQRCVERLEMAKKSRELPQNFDAEVVADVLMTFLQGVYRIARLVNSRRQLERQAETLLKALGL